MTIPEGMTLEEVLTIIDSISRRLAPKFCFGSHTKEDMKQQASMFAIQIMGKNTYDNSKPLENFLFWGVRNLLINFKRDNFKRTDYPCKLCYGKIMGDTGHDDRRFCDKHNTWQKRNLNKQNVLLPLDISNIADENESNTRYESTVVQQIEEAEILEIIDRELPVILRSTYLKMRDGVYVSKNKRLEIELEIDNILNGRLNEYSNSD